jgi:hypothetical protein
MDDGRDHVGLYSEIEEDAPVVCAEMTNVVLER